MSTGYMCEKDEDDCTGCFPSLSENFKVALLSFSPCQSCSPSWWREGCL